jgi:hypothetical protein
MLIRVNRTPSNPTFAILAPDPKCPQPCWRGIQLGVTTLDEAYTTLRADQASITEVAQPYEHIVNWRLPFLPSVAPSLMHWFGRPGNDVQAIRFDVNPFSKNEFKLADAIFLWGTPRAMSVYYCAGADAYHAVVDVFFTGNVQVRTVELFNDWQGRPVPSEVRPTPDLLLVMVRYYSDSNDMIMRLPPNWRGFRHLEENTLGFASMCDM